MKAFIVTTLARELINEAMGEFGPQTFVRVEKAYTSATKAETYANALAKQYKEAINVPGGSPIICLCERGVIEIDIETDPITEGGK
jgi:hypothetical protein